MLFITFVYSFGAASVHSELDSLNSARHSLTFSVFNEVYFEVVLHLNEKHISLAIWFLYASLRVSS